MRVLKWIADRCHGRANAIETPLGWVPEPNAIDIEGIKGYSRERLQQVQAINRDEWRRELLLQDELFMKLQSSVPKELIFQRELLAARL
jgi:phosphoenolpyruvate carboxykinase (GTP)